VDEAVVTYSEQQDHRRLPVERNATCKDTGRSRDRSLIFDVLLQEEQEDKPETPGETPDPQAFGLGGQRPLGLGVAVLSETPPPVPTAPPPVAKKRICVTPPPVPPRLDPEVICCVDICYWCFFFAQEKRFGIFFYLGALYVAECRRTEGV
jgi:hypothetical protein